MAEPLYVAFIWHMHQPYYKDTETGQYGLPWVRLHAVKDYLHFARVIGDYPEVHQTINVVPSLVEQIQEYASGTATDRALDLSRTAATPGATFDDAEKRQILDTFFSLNWDHFVLPYPRFAQLAKLREAANGDVAVFSDEFWRDLVAWYNLAWIDPSIRQKDARLQALFVQGRDYSAKDVATILDAHRALCGAVIPAYRELQERGLVELSTSPYFHPILPLLVDTDCAREASPELPLPGRRFRHPEDAREQLGQAMAFHERTFGRRPSGLWPSEGAVSQAAVDLIRERENIQWTATDEHVLERALGLGFGRDEYGHLYDPRPLFQPYRPRRGGPALFFRDQTLSDRVGFVYQHWASEDAAHDLVERLLHADRVLQSQNRIDGAPPVVSIVLDGENCWEFYPNNGDDFLRSLFARIGTESRLRAVTPSEYLAIAERTKASLRTVDRVPAASWIAGNLETWIGEPDQNRAWEYLAQARDALAAGEQGAEKRDPEKRRRAWHAMHVAEGSDWFWWYYSHNRVGGEASFDVHYRQHLANLYRAIDLPVPESLAYPIAGQSPQHERAVSGPLTIVPGGDRAAGAVWSTAGFVDADSSTGSMQVGARVFRRLYFGYDDDAIYVRADFGTASRSGQLSIFLGSGSMADSAESTVASPSSGPAHVGVTTSLANGPLDLACRVDLPDGSGDAQLLSETGPDTWTSQGPSVEVQVGPDSAEVRLVRSALRLNPGDEVYVAAALSRQGEVVEVVPTSGVARFQLAEVANRTVASAAAG